MTAENDFDRTLAAWFARDAAATPPPEPLARLLETTRARRPWRSLVADIGSHWVGTGSTAGIRDGLATLRPALVIALTALLVVALAGAAVLVGSRLLVPRPVHAFVSAPGLSSPMARPVLAPLPGGRVLAMGAGDGVDQTPSAEVYEPVTGTSVALGPMVPVRWVASATSLNDGRVLIIDGDGVAQIFDPAMNRFARVGPMVAPRSAVAALLGDGRVLVVGDDLIPGGATNLTAELFDPETLTFSATGSMGTSGSRLATLSDGHVFVAPEDQSTAAQVYDPATGAFSAAGVMPRFGVVEAVVIPDGRVVVVGSSRVEPGRLTSPFRGNVVVWDPTTRTFSPAGDPPGPVDRAILLDDGRVLLIGGRSGVTPLTAWAGIYDPARGVTIPIEPPSAWQPSLVRLDDGRVLAIGGLVDGQGRLSLDGTSGFDAPAVPTVQVFQ
jgi:hypothetical protein